MREFAFTVPSLPDRRLSPNADRRMHWSHKARAREEMEQSWGMAIKHARHGQRRHDEPMFDGPVSIHLAVYWPSARNKMDFDNLIASMKRGIDQLQHQKVLADDRQIEGVTWTQQMDPAKRGYVDVVVSRKEVMPSD